MFCPNCGKEIGEGLRFCGACGFDTAVLTGAGAANTAAPAGAVNAVAPTGERVAGTVNAAAPTADTVNMAQPAETVPASGAASATGTNTAGREKIYTREQVEQFRKTMREVEEKLIKSAKRTNVLAWIAKILLVAVPVLLLFKSLKNGSEIGMGTLVVLLFGVVPFYLYVYLVRGWLRLAKGKLAKEYFGSLSDRPLTELADMLKTSVCSVIKTVDYNPYDNSVHMALTGGKEVELRKDEQNQTVLTWIKGAVDEMLQDTLAVYLAKQITPSLGIDKVKVHKNNKLWKSGELLSGCAIFGTVAIYMIVSLTGINGQQYIKDVKTHVQDGYDFSYETAFDKVFDSGKWKYFVADDADKSKIVEYAGKINGRTVRLQWIVYPKESGRVEYNYYGMTINDESMSVLEQLTFIEMIYESAANNKEISGLGTLPDDSAATGSSGWQLADGSQNVKTQNNSVQNAQEKQSKANQVYADLEGQWDDKSRCFLKIKRTGVTSNIRYHITISWASSATGSTDWSMDAEYDPDLDCLWYENAYCENVTYYGNRTKNETVYTDGSGYFDISSDGILYWTSMIATDSIVDKDFYRN